MKSIFALSILLFTPTVFAATWDIDTTHTNAQFAVKHMMVSTVRGEFQNITGTVDLDEKDLTKSKIDVSIDATTINTRVQKRDDHLRSADFFDVANHPKLTFKSTKIVKGKDGKLLATGDLTIRGVTKPVTLTVTSLSEPMKNPWGMTVRGVSATGKINRKDFGLTWNKALEAGGVLVGDDVDLTIDAELVAKAPTPQKS
ncbi:MAG: polyisoprenoid-binding protein [Deltaproteobacteria bacterium]|nr:polyisoprenoid-binding protein [Deltaproteobacteria bacterium]